jgi:drug/metabolite transporter (DMT)-like permease
MALMLDRGRLRFILLCHLIVDLVWGSTYFAIRFGLESFPPLHLAGLRFLLGGAALYAFSRVRGAPAPTGVEWWAAARVGFLLLVLGNGVIVFAQQWVPSSMAAIVVSTMPLFAGLYSALRGQRPSTMEIGGLVLGFVGAVFIGTRGLSVGNISGLLLLVAPMSFAIGSMLSKQLSLPKGTMSVAAQMISGGIVLLAAGLVTGERIERPPSFASILALLHLIVFGSWIALSAYNWLLRNVRPAVATSYAYVNPLVAAALGVGLGGERLTVEATASGLVILLGVALISLSRSDPGRIIVVAARQARHGVSRAPHLALWRSSCIHAAPMHLENTAPPSAARTPPRPSLVESPSRRS